MTIEVRTARAADGSALARIDAATWTAAVSPAPRSPADLPFFGDRADQEAVLVADVTGVVAGYAALGNSIPLPSHRHVLELRGLAVDPTYARRGIGRRLVEECIERARRRGTHKLTLRVLAPNTAAGRLYAGCGFVVEGVLRDEFWLDGTYVDDVLMAHLLHAT